MQGSEDDGTMLTQAGTAFAVRAVSRDTVELRFGETEELVTVDDLGEMRDRITAVLEGR